MGMLNRFAAVMAPMALVVGMAGPAVAAPPNKTPAPTLTQTPAKTTAATTATFAWKVVSGTTYTCQLDGGTTAACASPKSYSGLTQRTHTFTVNATAPGNKPGSTAYSWTVNSTPPAAPVLSAVATPTRNTTQSISWTEATPGVTFTCKLDAAAAAACTSPRTLSGLAEGSHTFTVTAKNPAGATASASRTWVVDTTPPTAPVVTGPASPTTQTTANVTWTGNGNSYTCALDNGAATACTSPFATGTLAEGPHAVVVTPKDLAGNVGPSGTAIWVVDTTAPAPPVLVTGPAAISNTTAATIRFSDLDTSVASFTCKVDGAAAAACTSPFDTTVVGNGSHTVVVRALDAAGNPSTPLTVAWSVDTTAPAPAKFLTGPATPTSATVPVFTWQATDAGTVSYLCTLDGGTEAPCTTSTVWPAVTELPSPHTLVVKAVDGAANVSSGVTWSWVVDTTAPGAPTTTGATALGLVKAAPALSFSGPDASIASYQCSVDNGAQVACASGFVPTVADGTHSVAVVAVDKAGNVGTSALTFSFTLDSTKPLVATTLPVTLTDRAVFRFDEVVTGVSASTVTMGVPAVLSCRNAAGAVVTCAGPVRTAVTVPTKPLVPGQRYTAKVLAGVKDAAGNAIAAVALPYRGQLVQQESSAVLAETWRIAPAADAFGGRYAVDDVVGASATYAFTGTGITWYTITGPTMGLARVYVDNVSKGIVNNAAAARHTKVARTISGLAAGKHTLRIVVASAKPVVVDAVKVGATTVTNPVLTHRWGVSANRTASAGAFAAGDQRSAAVAMTFRGTSISWITIAGPTMGQAQVWIDGVLRATVDNYSATTKYGVKRTLSTTDALHTVRIVVLGQHRAGAKGNRVLVDALAVG
jgi:hypothetical protein